MFYSFPYVFITTVLRFQIEDDIEATRPSKPEAYYRTLRICDAAGNEDSASIWNRLLNYSVCQHRVRYLQEAGDVRARDVIALLAVSFACIQA